MSFEESSNILRVRKHNIKQASLKTVILFESFDVGEIEC